ncbi:MAG: GH1 family beta-glucosidase [Planctomycetota bacterium]
MATRNDGFPEGFVWGVAAASYQVEGAAHADGRGDSVWDMLCRKEGAIWKGHSGEVACDHYHRYLEDVAIMKQIGVKAYRLSVAWPRVLPEGVGAVNEKGLAFYDRLIDALLAAGIEPWVTLFHWDFPLALYHRGGWLNRDSADWFADYTQIVVRRLGDRVKHWMTHNEPQCTINLGHVTGLHAPGDKLSTEEALRAGHNLLRSHGKSAQAIRAVSPQPCQVGYAPVGHGRLPNTETPADIAAARAATFAVAGANPGISMWNASWWMDPVMFGHYPEDGLKLYGKDAPQVAAGDMQTIQQPLDFIGLNIYQAATVKAGPASVPETVGEPQGHPITTYTWPMTPSALYWIPRFWQERYNLPVVITENGLGNTDWVALDGKVHDPQRIDFLHRYLRELKRAAADGVDVRGYFQWSIMDNFEWSEGYKQRFGLVHVDYPTQKRTPKDSAWWYRDVIASNGGTL